MSSYIYFEDDGIKYLESTKKEYVDLCLCFCGIEVCKSSHSFGPAIREHYIIHYILDGKGIYKVGDKVYNLEKNQGFLICPGDLTYYEADNDDPWTYIWVAFNGIKSEQYLNRMRNCDELRLQGLLYLFLSTISDSVDYNVSENKDLSYTLYIEKSIEFINNNFANNIKVTDIANYVGLNRSYLSSLFKKSLNVSPQEFLLSVRMNKAYELLKKLELSIGDISRSVGYIDPLTFSKTFKKYSGYSPKQYRENLYKNNL